MRSKLRKLGIGVTLAVVIALTILALLPSGVGVACEVGTGGVPLAVYDLSAVPQSVAEDAARLATELFGDRQKEYDDFVNQILATYLGARDRDFVIVFNSGGWGWNLLEASPGWHSIADGIKSELAGPGCEPLLLSYQRTIQSLQGRLNELVEMVTRYPSAAKELASRVNFLTTHIPDLKVIIAGESNGTVICDMAMNTLEDNPQVYSIQTGPPFWHENIALDRTLLLTSNGIVSDSYSRGDFWAVVWGNLRYWFHLSQPKDDFGTEPHYVRAPGHDYWWQYPEVCSQITNFLEQSVGIE